LDFFSFSIYFVAKRKGRTQRHEKMDQEKQQASGRKIQPIAGEEGEDASIIDPRIVIDDLREKVRELEGMDDDNDSVGCRHCCNYLTTL